jgi:hypothetical protein
MAGLEPNHALDVAALETNGRVDTAPDVSPDLLDGASAWSRGRPTQAVARFI